MVGEMWNLMAPSKPKRSWNRKINWRFLNWIHLGWVNDVTDHSYHRRSSKEFRPQLKNLKLTCSKSIFESKPSVVKVVMRTYAISASFPKNSNCVTSNFILRWFLSPLNQKVMIRKSFLFDKNLKMDFK